MNDPVLSMREAVVYTGKHHHTLRRARGRGELESCGTPDRLAFRRSELEAWMILRRHRRAA